MQHQGTAEKALTRARESEVVVDTGRTGGLGHTGNASSGNLGKRAKKVTGGPAEEGRLCGNMNRIGNGERRRMRILRGALVLK